MQHHPFDVMAIASCFLLFGLLGVTIMVFLKMFRKLTCSEGHTFRRHSAYKSYCAPGVNNVWCPTCFDKKGTRNLVETDYG